MKRLNADQLTRNYTWKNIAISHHLNAEPFTTNSTPTYIAIARWPNVQPLVTKSPSTHSAVNRLNASQLTMNSTASTPNPPTTHCPWLLNMTRRRRNYATRPVDPPWTSLMANYSAAIASGNNLYVWACNPQKHRNFVNQLFNFAAVFGVAWHSQRIPLWTGRPTHVSMFQHRLVIDRTRQREVSDMCDVVRCVDDLCSPSLCTAVYSTIRTGASTPYKRWSNAPRKK